MKGTVADFKQSSVVKIVSERMMMVQGVLVGMSVGCSLSFGTVLLSINPVRNHYPSGL